MPELPEVETIRRGLLRASLIGLAIREVRVFWNKSVATHSPALFVQSLANRRIEGIERAGKFLVFYLDRGALWVHLKMSGKVLLGPLASSLQRYVRVQFYLGETALSLVDSRKFARMHLIDQPGKVPGKLGPDLLSLNLPNQPAADFLALYSKLKISTRPIKTALLDQSWIAGIGNIYADEALWRAGVHPRSPCCSLSADRVLLILKSALQVISKATEQCGTSLGTSWTNFCGVTGQAGHYQHALRVYGRAGKACYRCDRKIQKSRIAQRSSHFCPDCQIFVIQPKIEST